MNKNVIIYLLFSLFVLVLNWEHQQGMAQATYHSEVEQEEAIRLRILANSDSIQDQNIKRDIRDKVNLAITQWVLDIHSLEEASNVIEGNLEDIEAIVQGELARAGIQQPFTVKFESNVQFPTKLYGDLVYPAGEYPAVLITLGDGEGENWWCVLFPPLCFVDFANGDAVEHEQAEEEQEVKVSFFLVEKFNSFIEWVKTV